MLAQRILPCLDVKTSCLVKGVNFVGLRDTGDLVELTQTLLGIDTAMLSSIVHYGFARCFAVWRCLF